MKIISIVGNRPQFIKLKPVYEAIKKYKRITHLILHSGQHYDFEMSGQFFQEFQLPRPDFNIKLCTREFELHGHRTVEMLGEIEDILFAQQPDWVVVYGDTDTTLSGALGAAKLGLRVAHVESGLRCGRKKMAEEINRIAVDHLADVCFASTHVSMDNLTEEGIQGIFTGDVMYDIAKSTKTKIIYPKGTYVYVTYHRAENLNEKKMKGLAKLLTSIAKQKLVIFPVHPHTRQLIDKFKLDFGKTVLTEPYGYVDSLSLIKNADRVITDSGGVQREAFFFNVPCQVLREETEYPEIYFKGSELPRPKEPFGDGHAAEKIAKYLANNS